MYAMRSPRASLRAVLISQRPQHGQSQAMHSYSRFCIDMRCDEAASSRLLVHEMGCHHVTLLLIKIDVLHGDPTAARMTEAASTGAHRLSGARRWTPNCEQPLRAPGIWRCGHCRQARRTAGVDRAQGSAGRLSPGRLSRPRTTRCEYTDDPVTWPQRFCALGSPSGPDHARTARRWH